MLHTNPVLQAFGVTADMLAMQDIENIQRNPEDTIIHDYPCGFGKTTRMITGLKENPDQQVLIVVPDLEQVRAVIRAAHQRGIKLYQPLSEASEKEDKATGSPFQFMHETKRDALQALIQRDHKVITTHKLYSDIAYLARNGVFQNVEVHIDEVLSVAEDVTSITQFKSSQQRANEWRNLYVDKGFVNVCSNTGRIDPTDAWRDRSEKLAGNLPKPFFEAAEAGKLYTDIPGIGNHIIISELPIVLLKCAKQVNIYTYRFDGSYMAAYFQRHGVQYVKASYDDVSPEEADQRFRAKARDLVTINEVPRLRELSLGYTAQRRMLSGKSAALRQTKQVNAAFLAVGRALKKSGTSFDQLMLTCLKDAWIGNNQAGKFASGTKLFRAALWVANQTRGTNKYRHCSHVAYFWQQNPNRNVARFLECDDRGHGNQYAVSEMIQFIWRSRIRDGQPIIVYMPCEKMRSLWFRWLDGEN